ncbi:MAG TPA: YiiX/YebB-like N1pC/P60 family cysteine hydrolase [Vicinamibacterales bacterium]|nr:YiiX/YebB-like N1pC/P60 family cysteine hydrolase [Vicinamibacterales bacterium]
MRKPAGPAAEAETDAWVKTVREKADNGGWLVVRGTRVGDQTVAALTRATLSHAVVLDKQKEEIIEAVGSGVRVMPLRALLAQAHRVQIVRPPGWTPAAGQAAVARARSHVGQKYDWLGLVAAQRDDRFYCTELCVDSYQGREAGWKLGAVIFPADIATVGTLVFDSGPRDPESAQEPRFARRLAEARGVAYAAEVAPGLYRGGQPSAEGVAWLKSQGFKTVLNLRHYHGDSEKRDVESVGMRYERIALTSWGAPRPEQIARFLEIIRDPSLRPLYVHCQHGVDRTGAMMAVYRMEEEGWANPEAFAEMEFFDANRIWKDLREFVRSYRVRARPARLVQPR